MTMDRGRYGQQRHNDVLTSDVALRILCIRSMSLKSGEGFVEDSN